MLTVAQTLNDKNCAVKRDDVFERFQWNRRVLCQRPTLEVIAHRPRARRAAAGPPRAADERRPDPTADAESE
ncbi:hypothetical protein EVAR_31340_1 [Eumeta japonica]|uniref:Uncharacterized protein n=1 Tax=Eumeta variegata TaxID=151549 RepID=A0A4C1XYQ0_EUMVA|nr:hypothetical protein EVAR_31340_1 [Eumeta japonica]